MKNQNFAYLWKDYQNRLKIILFVTSLINIHCFTTSNVISVLPLLVFIFFFFNKKLESLSKRCIDHSTLHIIKPSQVNFPLLFDNRKHLYLWMNFFIHILSFFILLLIHLIFSFQLVIVFCISCFIARYSIP